MRANPPSASGIRVAPGSPFLVGGDGSTSSGLRVTTAMLPDDEANIDEIAESIARAAGITAGSAR